MLNPQLERLYAATLRLKKPYIREVLRLEDERAGLVATISGGISRAEAELLCEVVSEVRPVHSLEVGLGYGFSAVAICSAAPVVDGRRHIVIDPHQSSYWGGAGMQNLRDGGFAAIVTLHEECSHRVLPMLEREGEQIDFAFIDGWHTFDFVFVDFFFIDKMLREGGVVAFDDADWPSIRPVIRYVVTNLGYSVMRTLPEKRERAAIDRELGIEGSCIVLRKERAADTREIFFHQPFF